ncbi:MAG: HEPN domain-containing protein [Bacteroidota bacterium]
MNKQDQIDFWKISAGKSLTPAKSLFETGNYVACLFFLHLSLEQLLKAHWVKDNVDNVPPKTHHLLKLAGETQLNLDASQIAFLQAINNFQILGRYPDDQFQVYTDFDEPKTKLILDEVENIFQWLLNKLP